MKRENIERLRIELDRIKADPMMANEHIHVTFGKLERLADLLLEIADELTSEDV